MSQMIKQERFPLLRTSLLKMRDCPLFPRGRKQASSRILNFSNFWKNEKSGWTFKYDFWKGVFLVK